MMKEQSAQPPRAAHAGTVVRPRPMRQQPSYHNEREEVMTASPHHAGYTAGLHPECTPYTSSEPRLRSSSSQTLRRPARIEETDTADDEAVYPQRMPTSVRRYWPVEEQGTHAIQPSRPTSRTVVRYHRQPIPARSSRTQDYPSSVQPPTAPRQIPTSPAHPTQERRHTHWLVEVGLIVLAGVAVFIGVSIVLQWWQGVQDDWHYGRPRTYQCDARVGHNDAHTPSHFLALNLHRQVEIIEFPGGDATKARVYLGPILIGDGQDLTPVTLEFRDVNGDGKPDILLHIGTQNTLVYLNDNGAFRPAKSSDHISL